MPPPNDQRRIISVNQPLVSQTTPALRPLRPRKLSDFPQVPKAHLDAARVYSSPLLMGPPICEELIAFIQHLFTEEEAGVVRHLGLLRGHTAKQVSRLEHRPVEQVEAILTRLAEDKNCIIRSGPEDKRSYRLLPIMPGVFEMVLIRYSPETLTDWHRRFIELFETLYETGYSLEYSGSTSTMVRYLPVGRAIDAHPMALPSDQLERVLDRFDVFGVGQCQCRLTMQAQGRGCGKPLGNCAVMGKWAERGIRDGWLRQVSREEMIDIKREAEAHDMVNWMMNVESSSGQNSCSCCGCCCHAMRMVSQFNAPALFAPPHFHPRLELAKCTFCGRCVQKCPMKAIVVDAPTKTWQHIVERCVGCGLCTLACDRQRALAMEPIPEYRLPYKSWFSLLAHNLPGMLKSSWKVWRSRDR